MKQLKKINTSVIAALASTLLITINTNSVLAANLHLTELSDETLSHMRGKFVAPGQVMYFGVEMVTHWQSSTGELVTATANLGIDFSQSVPEVGFSPTITVQQNDPTATTQPQGSSQVSGAGGLDNVTGVVQNIQVAGVSNGITNTISLNVEPSSGNASSLPSVSGPSTFALETATGTAASVNLADNNIGVAITVPDQGRAIQQIRSIASRGGQVQQSVQVGGDQNQIRNRLNLNVQMNDLSPTLPSTSSLLSSMRLLPPTTIF